MRSLLRARYELNPTQRSAVPAERIGLHPKPLQDGDEQLCQRKLFHRNLALPAGIRVDSSASLIVLVPLAELEVPAIGETEVLAAGGNDGVVGGISDLLSAL